MQAGHRPSQDPRYQLQEAGHHSLRGETIFSLELSNFYIDVTSIFTIKGNLLLFYRRLDLDLFEQKLPISSL